MWRYLLQKRERDKKLPPLTHVSPSIYLLFPYWLMELFISDFLNKINKLEFTSAPDQEHRLLLFSV